MNINKGVFGKLSDGTEVEKIELINDHQLKVSILTYGGIFRVFILLRKREILKILFWGMMICKAMKKTLIIWGLLWGRLPEELQMLKFL